MTPASSSGPVATNTYPASVDPLLRAARANFDLDQQVAARLNALSDKIDGLRVQLMTRNSLINALSRAAARDPAASHVDFMQVDAAGRDRLLSDLKTLGLDGMVTAIGVTGSATLFTFRVERADTDALGEGLSQGVQSLLTLSQTQQLVLHNETARYSTLGQTVASLQKTYLALASSLNRSLGG